MHIRPLNTEDYEILKGFWHEWNFEAPCRDFLPDNGNGGYIVMDEEVPVVAGFLYETNAKVAWISWIISNRSYRKKPDRNNAIYLLLNYMTVECSKRGYDFVYTAFNNSNLTHSFEELGYVKGSDKIIEMTKTLKI